MAKSTYQHIAKPPAPGAPLVFTFHGTGGDEHQFSGLVGQIFPEAGIVSPRGDVSEHGAARFFRRTGEGIYDMDDLAARTQKMKGFIKAHKDSHPGSRIYGLGYSNGANILALVMFEAPELFDRVVLMHPLIPWTPEPNASLKSVSVLVTAGQHDPICPLPMTQSLVAWLEVQGTAVELTLHGGGHELRQEELAAVTRFLS